MAKHIFVTGGLGYIGSHTACVLLEQGHQVTLFDNLDNSYQQCLDRLCQLAGSRAHSIRFIKGDVRELADLRSALGSPSFDAVIHFAAHKYVGESMEEPLMYFDHNVKGTINLLQAMEEAGCFRLVFSSSATVYGQPREVPLRESHPLNALNPYGRTKIMMEDVMRDVAAAVGLRYAPKARWAVHAFRLLAPADGRWGILLLHYFNPVGAYPCGRIGEHPLQPTNLAPAITEVLKGRRRVLSVFGNDYNTRDGTAIRDYIHIMDLAEGHAAALRKLLDPGLGAIGCKAYNLGTGTGHTVMEVVKAFEEATGQKVPLEVAPRRAGDAEAVYAAVELAERELGWKARGGLGEMCAEHWGWVSKNPQGYLSKSGAPEPAGPDPAPLQPES